MRKECQKVLKKQFHIHLIRSRDRLGITQSQMACRLHMACRSYIELDHGTSCCGGLTFMLYLIYICADPIGFLVELQYAIEQECLAV